MNYNKTKINDNVDASKKVLCQLKEIGMSCFGCCGNHFTTEEGVMEGVRKNAVLLKQMIRKHRGNLEKMYSDMKNNHDELRADGICKSLINLKDLPWIDKFYDVFPKRLIKKGLLFGCPMHPVLNNGKDFRTCEIWHECKSYFLFKKWDKKKQNKFIKFLKKKIKKERLSVYQYSVGLDTGKFVDEFLRS